MSDISADLRTWEADNGFAPAALAWLFPLAPTCEFANLPMHGCECNGCVMWRADGLEALA